MVVSCFLSRNILRKIDVGGLHQVLKALGYRVRVFCGNLLVESTIGPYESREHASKELRMDIEALLERFRIKK